jgi:hypothetical protein
MKHPRMTRVVGAVIALAFLASASIAVAQDEPAAGTAATDQSSLAQARSTFSVLAGKTAVPPQILHASLPVEKFGLDISQSVRVPAPKDDVWADSWYVVPGSKGVCLAMIEGVTCDTFTNIQAEGMLWMLGPSKTASDVPADAPAAMKGWQVRALVPDGNSSVTVSGLNRGVTGAGTPQNNVLNLLLPRGGDSFAVRDDAGKVVHEESVVGGASVR